MTTKAITIIAIYTPYTPTRNLWCIPLAPHQLVYAVWSVAYINTSADQLVESQFDNRLVAQHTLYIQIDVVGFSLSSAGLYARTHAINSSHF